jgi:ATP-dependent helicase/nuclease subunit A
MTSNSPDTPQIITVKSSAGAGKTYNLALRYLQLLVADTLTGAPTRNHISNIVAITFTNKAAAEMRARIIDWMKRIILDIPFENSARKPIEEIMGETRVSGQQARQESGEPGADSASKRAAIRRTVSENFEAMLCNFYDFKVSTIDSFVNLILKASAFKLDLPPDFEISTESRLYSDFVLQECLQRIFEDGRIREKFDRFLRNYIEVEGENSAWIPKAFLRDIINNFWKEEAKEDRECVRPEDPIDIEGLRELTGTRTRALIHYLETTPGIRPNQNFLKALKQLSAARGFEFKGSSYFKRERLGACLNKGSDAPDEKHDALWLTIRRSLSKLVEAYAASKFSSYVEIYDLFKGELRAEITQQKRIVLIEQLNKLLRQVVEREYFVPEIYYALAERYSHFLIDEFQDTNHLQWQNIETLAEEALSRGGTLFLVGDKKQAIYHWRGGKSELVDEISSRYQAYRVDAQRLGVNYRSGENIVCFNNELFDAEHVTALVDTMLKECAPEDTLKIVETYRGSSQQHVDSRAGAGYVRIERIVRQDREGEPQEEAFTKDEQNELIKDRFAALVAEIRAKNVFQDRDIAVLVRRREEAEFIVRVLLEMGVAVDSDFTVNVKNNPLIKEMINLLQFINAPDDDMSFAAFITGQIFARETPIQEQEIVDWIAKNRIGDEGLPLYRLFQKDYPHLWERFFERLFKTTGYLPLYESVVLFVKQWSIADHFPEDFAYFLHVCELIKERESMGENNLTGFLQFWNEGSENALEIGQEREAPFLLKTVGGLNAVKVLTVHKAKGLQFPVVILPYLKLNTFGASDSRDKNKFFVPEGEHLKLLYIKKDFTEYSERLETIYWQRAADYLLDELNNVYVACTRPERELYAFLIDSQRQRNYLIDYLFHLEPLKQFCTGDVMEIGARETVTRYGLPVESLKIEGEEAGESQKGPILDDFGHDIKWMERIRAKFEAPQDVSRNQMLAKRRGDVIHHILSLIEVMPDDQAPVIEAAIRIAIAKFGFEPQRKQIQEAIERFFQNPQFRRFFAAEEDVIVYREKEIIASGGEAYKVDRILIRGDNMDIVDFKTGGPRAEEHREQISNYGCLLQKIHPEKQIRKHLLYIEENRVESL